MLLRVPEKNYETIQISHFASDGQLEDKTHTVVVAFDMAIPSGMGDLAAAAMAKGLDEFFLKHVLTGYDQTTKATIDAAEETIKAFQKQIKKNDSGLILP